ncbi:thioesterase II family protein [Metabacillus fastidiosus]|uniref:Thioesterase domain-containing protein n=1 Tax=Metabacillus fastidiosus TaxID=1458 RepID=A0ABU6NVT8_9BACI|nr:thioesterase domain-containing protein [Metabacillus fastidiosus]MED4400359.1 thioesterase domain-containing protein [Metabacillus fastidiosus]
MNLFCLPYAGGSEAIYFKWNQYLSRSINLCPIPLKGRGKRFNEPLYENIEEAVDDIFNTIQDKIDENEYALYGHSMGSLLVYELYYKIKEMGFKLPNHLFFSGYRSPGSRKKEIIYNLPDNDFKKKIIQLGGTPEELVNNKELFEVFLPVLKSDFKMVETYKYKERTDKIACDISVLNGNGDSISFENLLDWKNYTNQSFQLYHFDGNHFFINNNIENITSLINKTLNLTTSTESKDSLHRAF